MTGYLLMRVFQMSLAHRLDFEPGSPDYETTALPTELPRLLYKVDLLLEA